VKVCAPEIFDREQNFGEFKECRLDSNRVAIRRPPAPTWGC